MRLRAAVRAMGWALLAATATDSARADTFTVSKFTDTNDGACNTDCSLREAVRAANVHAGFDTIRIPAGTYNLAIAGAKENNNATGDLDVRDTVLIEGVGQADTIIDGNDVDRVFDVWSAGVKVRDVTVRNGRSIHGGSGLRVTRFSKLTLIRAVVTDNVSECQNLDNSEILTAAWLGGAILSIGDLTLAGVDVISNNSVGCSGGGVVMDVDYWPKEGEVPTAFVLQTRIMENRASGNGGGILADQGTRMTLIESVVEGNKSGQWGGGIENRGSLTVEQCRIRQNWALFGGGLHNQGSVVMKRSTIAANTASQRGGGIVSLSKMVLRDSTVNGNSAGNEGGGILANGGGGDDTMKFVATNVTISWNVTPGRGGAIRANLGTPYFLNSTIANNRAGASGAGFSTGLASTIEFLNTILARNILTSGVEENCGGGYWTFGYNVFGDASCLYLADGDVIADPLLGSLQNNGGPTRTMELLSGSPAINAAYAPECPARDQRDFTRPDICDIGAYELGGRFVPENAPPFQRGSLP